MEAVAIQQLAPPDRGGVWIVFEAFAVIVGLFALLIVMLSVFDESSARVDPQTLPAGTPYAVYETVNGRYASVDCPSLWQVRSGDTDPLCNGTTNRSVVALVVSSIVVAACTAAAAAAHRQRRRVRTRSTLPPDHTWSYEQRARPLGLDAVLFILAASGLYFALLQWQPDGLLVSAPLLLVILTVLFWRATWRPARGRATRLWLPDIYTLGWRISETDHEAPLASLRRIVVRPRPRLRLGAHMTARLELSDGTAVETIAGDELELRTLLAFVATVAWYEPDVLVEVRGGAGKRWPAPEMGRNPRRELTADERAALVALLDGNLPERDVLVDQLDGLRARQLDESGSLELRVRPEAPRISPTSVVVSAVTEDEAGTTVSVLLHVVAGRLAELEVLREDGMDGPSAIDPSRLTPSWSTWSE